MYRLRVVTLLAVLSPVSTVMLLVGMAAPAAGVSSSSGVVDRLTTTWQEATRHGNGSFTAGVATPSTTSPCA